MDLHQVSSLLNKYFLIKKLMDIKKIIDIAGKGISNPIASIRSAALLLEHIGYVSEASRIHAAVDTVLSSGHVDGLLTPDLGGKGTTRGVTDSIISKL